MTAFERITPWRRKLRTGIPAHVLPLDRQGVGQIAWLVSRFGDIERGAAVFAHRGIAACSVPDFRRARDGDAHSALQVGYGISFAQEECDEVAKVTSYPTYVNWGIARAWIERAAGGGSTRAKKLLEDAVWTQRGLRIGNAYNVVHTDRKRSTLG